jgi:predicted AAA+ superfamily ATPase
MLYPRKAFSEMRKNFSREEFIILTGARQVGKTSLLLMAKEYLEKKGEICHYFNLENSDYLKAFNLHPFELLNLIPQRKTRQIVFIDEIQYLNNPTNFLKLLYDEKRNQVKIIASGSSSFYIDKKFKDSLVGRKVLLEIYPLDFDEFLIFHKQEDLLGRKEEKIQKYYRDLLLDQWEEYLRFGGYPKVVLAEDEEAKKMALEEIAYSYIKKDIADAGIKNSEKYFSLLKILAGQTGQLVNAKELADTLDLAQKTVAEYLYVVKKSYQAAFVRPFHRNIRKELTKMPKVYFFDSGLRNFFLDEFSPIEKRADKGVCLENIVYRELLRESGNADKVRFWRTQDGKEIDFVFGKKAYEVKFDRKNKKNAEKYSQFFEEAYPEIQFDFLSYDGILEKFYGWIGAESTGK